MQKSSSKAAAARRERFALVFAALGDETRLALLAKLGRQGGAMSLGALAEDSALTRQAISKHLRVLEGVGLVRCQHVGREALFTHAPAAVDSLRRYLDEVSAEWDDSLARLKAFAER